MADKTLFEKIIDREIPADILFEDETVIAFMDINPQAPFHALVCPKKPVAKVSDAEASDEGVLGHCMTKAADIAKDAGFEDFRLVVNNGAGAGQTVFHIHVHVLAGRSLTWPPG
ncbi:MAG: histidine triad nucleotide-binding protein [Pseudomonadota bacterium]